MTDTDAEQPRLYEELPGHAVNPAGRFTHVMALALNPQTGFKDGVIRCITSREGSVDVSGFVDHSELHVVQETESCRFEIGERLLIHGEEEMITSILPIGYELIGFEDPDLAIGDDGLLHLYFTIAFVHRAEGRSHIYLGHALGKDLQTLCMTEPVLARKDTTAKEVSLVPKASDGIYRHLIESSAPGTEFSGYSTVRGAKAAGFGPPWEFGETLLHPAHHAITWMGGHVSPGPLVPSSFLNVGEGKLLGFLNGREADSVDREQVVFGVFSIGLFIYDYEHGQIVWVSPLPFIIDSEATTITFASQFVQTKPGKAILYAHVDDSFVRAYKLSSESLKKLIPLQALSHL